MRIDLHTHTVVSDGTDTPAELVAHAAAAGLDVVALTDHDTFDGVDEAVAAGQLLGIEVVPRDGAVLLPRRAERAPAGVRLRPGRPRPGRGDGAGAGRPVGAAAPVLAKLAELGVPVTEAAVLAYVGSSPSVGRPHIADALVAAGHVRTARRRSTGTWPTVARRTSRGTPSRSAEASNWFTPPAGWR